MRESVLIPDDRLHARVLYLNRLPLWPWWKFTRLCDGFWRLYRHDRDGASIVHRGRDLPLPAGRVLLIPAGVPFATRPAPDIVQFYLHIDLLGVPPEVGERTFNRPWLAPDTPALRHLVDHLADRYERLPGAAAVSLAKSAFFQALGGWMATLPPETAANAMPALHQEGRISECLRAMSNDPGQPWSIAQLAARCGLSPSRFSHVFRAQVGASPARWLVERRLAVAAQHLAHGEAAIPAIAANLGWHDRHHFTRAFSRRFGIAPAAYRAHAQAALGPAQANVIS